VASGDKSSFCFQPIQLHLEWPDLLGALGLQGVLVVLTLGATRGENLRDLLWELMFPGRDLRGMHPVDTGSLIDRFVPLDGVQRDPSFELRAVPFPRCRHLPSPQLLTLLLTQPSIFITCPVFGVHYTHHDTDTSDAALLAIDAE